MWVSSSPVLLYITYWENEVISPIMYSIVKNVGHIVDNGQSPASWLIECASCSICWALLWFLLPLKPLCRNQRLGPSCLLCPGYYHWSWVAVTGPVRLPTTSWMGNTLPYAPPICVVYYMPKAFITVWPLGLYIYRDLFPFFLSFILFNILNIYFL